MSHQINTNRLFRLLASALAAVVLWSCSSKEDPEGAAAGGLRLTPTVEGAFVTKATVPDVTELMEDDLSGGVNVYISGHGVFKKYTLASPVNGKTYFISSTWKDEGIVVGQTYDVYAVANGTYDNSLITSAEDLMALRIDDDVDIYRLYDENAGTFDLAKTTSKIFVMDGKTSWTAQDAIEQTIEVTLERAAAKIEVNFHLDETMSGYTIQGIPQWKLVNYSTDASLMKDGVAEPYTVATNPTLMNVTTSTSNGGSITTYTYPYSWSEADSSMAIILNIPLKDASGAVIATNYYCIPIVDPDEGAPYDIERNTLYRIDATIESIGSSSESTTDQPLRLRYEVLNWVYNPLEDDVNVEGREVEYLMVDPLETEIREKVLSTGYIPQTISLNFWSSGNIIVSEPVVYYYDKNGVRQNAPSSAPTSVRVSGDKNGTLDVTSTALSNNTVKYIKFRVSLASNQTLYEDILIRHFPLDYIQNIAGLWSSRVTEGWVDWSTDQTAHTPQKTVSAPNSLFRAKVYTGSSINYIVDQWRGSNMYYAVVGQVISNLHNNRMYIVQITSTSDDYILGRVTLDSNYQSQEHLVSPAFMIASQLGATQPTTSATDAATQCGLYKEVTAEGVAYTGWRLPTREEVGIIMGYQYVPDAAIDEVLAGDHYWTLEGRAVSKTNYSQSSFDGYRGYIRCVRDLSADEVREFNNKD